MNKTIDIMIPYDYKERFEHKFLMAFKSVSGKPPKGFGFILNSQKPAVTVVLPEAARRLDRTIIWESELIRPDGAVVCGFSLKNDITFSSLRKNRLVICLSRPVSSVYGSRIEPQEFCVRGCLGDAYPILAAAAVKILTQKQPG